MNELESYISFIKEKTADYSELEKVRYVYIDLGKKMTFDLNFAFGDKYMKEYIYKHCFYNLDDLNEFFKKKTIICKSLALLFQYIVKELGIKITSVNYIEINGYNHVYNVITLKDDSVFAVDLQRDLENIQSHSKTKYFGMNVNNKDNIINDNNLKDVDLNIGYITIDNFYTDEYYYLMKPIVDSFSDLSSKISFILNNINQIDDYKNMNVSETRWYYLHTILLYLTEKEKNKKIIFDLYYVDDKKVKYTFAFFINDKHSKNIFLYDDNLKVFHNMTLLEFKNKLLNGLNPVCELPKLLARSLNKKIC